MNKKDSLTIARWSCKLLFLFAAASSAPAAELHPDTLKAWRDSVEITEKRIEKEMASSLKFLALDFQDSRDAVSKRKEVLSGKIPIDPVPTGPDGKSIPVPDGIIHHWRGSVLIPGVPLDFLLSRIRNPNYEETKQEDVLDSRILEKTPDQLKLYLKLQRSKIVTVAYNTEHLVQYKTNGNDRASSRSISTKIAEIEHVSGNLEKEKPEGRDHGYLWKMNSYWRYQQVKDGVIVELESMTLSRSVPALLGPLVNPIIHKIARESMERTLKSMRARLVRAYHQSRKTLES
jgi:hypothetical protein